jgi:transcriptional regulator with XRE-family HTH domain
MTGISRDLNGTGNGNPAQHFGRQVKKARRDHGWSLPELGKRSGVNAAHLSRIETGKRPPTERIALAMDKVFPERLGWFLEYYEELQGWSEVPAAFRDWSEFELSAANLWNWTPSIVTGLLQTEDYARTLFSVVPGITPEVAEGRLTVRMDRQRRVLFRREDPPRVLFVVDEAALYRMVGSPEIMAAQLQHLIDVASLPHVTLQVLPLVAHCANASGIIIAGERAAYAEHQVGGFTYTDEQTVTALALQFDTLRGECHKVSETVALLGRIRDLWATGVNPLIAMVQAATASK